jgi:hypothetical protein
MGWNYFYTVLSRNWLSLFKFCVVFEKWEQQQWHFIEKKCKIYRQQGGSAIELSRFLTCTSVCLSPGYSQTESSNHLITHHFISLPNIRLSILQFIYLFSSYSSVWGRRLPILQPTYAYCTNPIFSFPFHLQARSTSDDAKGKTMGEKFSINLSYNCDFHGNCRVF